jgi:hypothetical protein
MARLKVCAISAVHGDVRKKPARQAYALRGAPGSRATAGGEHEDLRMLLRRVLVEVDDLTPELRDAIRKALVS